MQNILTDMVKQFLHRILDFLKVSHRWSHLVGGFAVGLFFGADAAACVGIAFGCKDVQHDKKNTYRLFVEWTWKAWDWIDLGLTVAGGLLGSLVRLWVIGRFM